MVFYCFINSKKVIEQPNIIVCNFVDEKQNKCLIITKYMNTTLRKNGIIN